MNLVFVRVGAAVLTRWLVSLLVIALAVAAFPRAGIAAAAEAGSPTAVVKQLNDTLLGVLKDGKELGFKGRADRLTPAVNQAFDVSYMAEKSLGGGWKSLSEADRQRWVELSRQFSVANYAANFDHDAGQKIEIEGEEAGAADTMIVKTNIIEANGDKTAMSYRLRKTDSGWKIIDVYLKGTVSELALRRSDYSSVLTRQGFPALVTTMQTKIDDLASGRAKRGGA